ncbi:MAG: NADPH:quinone oxidoreductase family protein [Alphaproteobacteria bacterium]|nr:NADPH:quinone oxidoreductase family protein [Alphaproteobacteria bacterium]
MRAILCREWGPPEKLRLEEVPSPALHPNGVRIRIEAAGINFADLLLISGQYQEKPAFPFSPGLEVAGLVTECGTTVTTLAPGQRVMAVVAQGGFAEEVVAEASAVFPIPDRLDFIHAAGFPVAYGTSHGALAWRAGLEPGETLLVNGAAGGVGLTAVEIGKAMGARVIATAGGEAKLRLVGEHGADCCIDSRAEDIRARVKELTDGRGADVVYDPVGGSVFEASLRATAWGGRILLIGFASGEVPQIPANVLLVKNIAVHGYVWGGYVQRTPERVRDSLAQLLGWWEEGKLRPHVSETLPLERAVDALNLLKTRRSTGKVVLTPKGG